MGAEIAERALAGLAIALALCAVYWLRIADPDLWGHLRYGRFFLENGVGTADPFAYTAAGQPWYAHEYLAQIALWLTYAAGGAGALIALKCLLGAAAVALHGITLAGLGDGARIWAPLLAVDAVLLGSYFFFRPQLFTFLGTAFFAWLVFRHLVGRPAPLWILPFAMALWANLHGGFVAGIGVLGLGLGLRAIQTGRARGSWRAILPLALTLAACIVAGLATPLGPRTWRYLAIELSNPYNHGYIGEWRPVRLAAPGTDGWALLVLAGLALLAWWLAELRGDEVYGLRPWQWLASCLPVFALAFLSHRQIPIAALWCGPVVATLAAAALAPVTRTAGDTADRAEARRWSRVGRVFARLAADPLVPIRTIAERAPTPATGGMGAASAGSSDRLSAATGIWRLATLAAFIPAIGVAVTVLLDPTPRIRIAEGSFGPERPVGAVAFMKENGLAGNLYLPLWWGSYATWELYPGVRVSMDGRNDTAYPVERVGENLLFYAEGYDPAAPLRHDTDFLLVPARYPVLPAIEADARWRRIYHDRDAVLFARSKDAGPAPAAAEAPSQERNEQPALDFFE